MALSKSDYIDIALLIKDAVAIITSTTPAGAATRTAYAVLKRTPQGERLIEELESRGIDAFNMVGAIATEFRQEEPLEVLVDSLRASPVASMNFSPRPLTRFPSAFGGTGMPSIPKKAKRKLNKFSKAVKVGMKVVKDSTSYGKKGVINNAKKAFTVVTKTASKINKGQKVAKAGIRRKIGLAVKKVLK